MIDVVRCRAATRSFQRHGLPPVTAVDQVDLVVAAGEFVAIQGPSGSGKTTLLGLIAGIDRADGGQVEVLGHDLARLTPTERARLRRTHLGIVFQSFGLVSALTAGENVAMPLALDGIPSVERGRRAAEALAAVGLADAAELRIDELSGGERQRVGVARALVAEPMLVIADEPAGSLDDATGSIVLDLLRSAARDRGAGVLLVTHDPASGARADRSLRMLDGRLHQGAPR